MATPSFSPHRRNFARATMAKPRGQSITVLSCTMGVPTPFKHGPILTG